MFDEEDSHVSIPAWTENYHTVRLFSVCRLLSAKVTPEQMSENSVFHYSIPNVQTVGTGVEEDGSSIASDKLLISEPCVLISKLNPRKSTVCLASPQSMLSVASTEFVSITAGDDTGNRYLFWVLRSSIITQYLSSIVSSTTNSHQRVQPSDVYGMDIPWPAKETRTAIYQYLDRETGEIDAMLAKLTSLSELVSERRREIMRSVLKSVGQTVRLGLVVDVVSGSGFPDKFQGVPDEELPFYKVSSLSNMDRQVLTDSGNTVSREIADQLGARVIPSQSVVMAKIGAALLLARYALTSRPSCIDNNMQALVAHRDVIVSRFLAYAMEDVSIPSLVKSGPVPSLDVMGMKMSRIAFSPSIKEQCRIADHLDEVTGRIDAMLTKIDELKALLVERRAALISDVVTGRKKVA